jgi:hypothetical protein
MMKEGGKIKKKIRRISDSDTIEVCGWGKGSIRSANNFSHDEDG